MRGRTPLHASVQRATPQGPGPLGRFVVFEGIDGSGKSTAVRHVAEALAESGADLHVTREETETWLGEAVRRSVADRADPLVTTFLFLADRAGHVPAIRAELDQGRDVLCDRFLHSTLAYQSVTLAERFEDPVAYLRDLHTPLGLEPDHVLLFDVDPETAVERMAERADQTPYEKVAFLRKVRTAYLGLAEADDRIQVLDASRPLDDVLSQATATVRGWLTD